jgi:hypothetical protein
MAIKILFLAANPENSVRLRLDEEAREIDHKILLAQKKDEFVLCNKGAVRVGDLQLYLNLERPDVVHFSGHGTSDGEIVLEDNTGKAKTVSTEALARVFETLKDNIRCVVLNACFSFEQADEIKQNIDCVIGMSSSIGDEAAIAFSAAFYLALSSERSIQNAFDQGKTEIMLLGIHEENTPQLLHRDEIDPSKIFLSEVLHEPESMKMHAHAKLSWNEEAEALRFGKPDFPSEVYEGEPVKVTGTITNAGSVPIPLKSVVIAVRPPNGTVENGPFRYDFAVKPDCIVNPGEKVPFSATKAIEIDAISGMPQEIPDKYIDDEWFGFMACQTEDCVWRNDTSKSRFVVRRKSAGGR